MKTIHDIMKLAIRFLLAGLLLGSCTKAQDLILRGRTVFKDAAPSTPVDADTIYALINAGQSNDAGRALTSEFTSYGLNGLITNGTRSAYTKNYMLNDSLYEVLETGVNSSDRAGEGGVQVFIGDSWINYRDRDLYIIQSAEGGRPITDWQAVRPKWHFIDSSVSSLEDMAAAQGKVVKWLGMVWIQGETQGGTDSATWRLEANSLFARTRAITRADLPVIIVQALDCQSAVSGLSALQAVQASVASGTYNILIPKSVGPNTCKVDNLHYGVAQYDATADAIFQYIKDL